MNRILDIVTRSFSFLGNGFVMEHTEKSFHHLTYTSKLAANWFPLLRGGLGWGLCQLLLANCLLATAQSFPVQVMPQAIPPAPIYFSDYADAGTINGPLRVQLVLNDLGIANREIRLKAYFEGNGIAFQSNDMVSGAGPLYLEGGIPLVLTNAELSPYFRFENITGISPNIYGQAIPEGRPIRRTSSFNGHQGASTLPM